MTPFGSNFCPPLIPRYFRLVSLPWFQAVSTCLHFRRLLQRSNDRYARYRQSLNESIQVKTLELQHNNDEALFENSFDEDLELSEFSSDEDELGEFGYEIVDDLLNSSDEEESENSITDSEVSDPE